MESEISFYLEKQKKINGSFGKNHPCYVCGFYGYEYKEYMIGKSKEEFNFFTEIFKSLDLNFKVKDSKFFSVEISACKEHERNLALLEKLAIGNHHLLTKKMVEISVETLL